MAETFTDFQTAAQDPISVKKKNMERYSEVLKLTTEEDEENLNINPDDLVDELGDAGIVGDVGMISAPKVIANLNEIEDAEEPEETEVPEANDSEEGETPECYDDLEDVDPSVAREHSYSLYSDSFNRKRSINDVKNSEDESDSESPVKKR